MKNGCYWKERAGCSSCRQNQQGRGWGWKQGRSLALALCRGIVGPIFLQRHCRTYFFFPVAIMDIGCTRKDASHFPPCYEHLVSEHLIYTAIHCTAVFYRENSNSYCWVAVRNDFVSINTHVYFRSSHMSTFHFMFTDKVQP